MSLSGTNTSADQDRDPVNGRYRSKHTDSRIARVKRIKARHDELLATYTIVGPADNATLALAATLYADAEVARSRISRVRCINAALRLLKPLQRKQPKLPTIDELLGRTNG